LLHHFNREGDTATMQAINEQYAFANAQLLNGAGLSEEEIEKAMRFSEEYQQVIEKIAYLPDATIELVGLWVWVVICFHSLNN
jgi:hypothetical protein